MPDTRQHRGPHPGDAEQFAARCQPLLNRATEHLSWLLSRDYAATSALKLVGDRFQLTRRQRLAVLRCACSDTAREARAQRQVTVAQMRGQRLEIDGFNVLTTVEAALSGGVLILGRDGCCRDMASMHGSFRRVEETLPALILLGETLQHWRVEGCVWWLDRPVSNSGRLGALFETLGQQRQWPWQARLAADADRELIRAEGIVASADSVVLDRAGRWFNLAAEVVRARLPEVQPLRLGGQPAE